MESFTSCHQTGASDLRLLTRALHDPVTWFTYSFRAPGWSRTTVPPIKSRLLWPLSYEGMPANSLRLAR